MNKELQKPPTTCHLIDVTKEELLIAVKRIEEILRYGDFTQIEKNELIYACCEIEKALNYLEEIRRANIKLREYGNYWEEKSKHEQDICER